MKHLVQSPASVPSWTFLTNHAHVLVCLAQDHEIRLAEVARRVGIGERAVHTIVKDLVEAGYLSREKVGRRNHYQVHPDLPLRHPIEQDHQVTELLRLVKSPRKKA